MKKLLKFCLLVFKDERFESKILALSIAVLILSLALSISAPVLTGP